MNFSLRSLMLTVAFVSLGCFSLLSESAIAVHLTSMICLTWLLFAVLFAIYRPAKERPFWLGFALFGGVYAWYIVEAGPSDVGTSIPLHWIHRALYPPPPSRDPRGVLAHSSAHANFIAIGVWLWTPIVGLMGAFIAKRISSNNRRVAQEVS
jgi:hypothetical protein